MHVAPNLSLVASDGCIPRNEKTNGDRSVDLDPRGKNSKAPERFPKTLRTSASSHKKYTRKCLPYSTGNTNKRLTVADDAFSARPKKQKPYR
jgi:hypothetical protein